MGIFDKDPSNGNSPGLTLTDPNICIIRNTSSMFGEGFAHARMPHFSMEKSGLDFLRQSVILYFES